MLINVKMPTAVGIQTLIIMINTPDENSKARFFTAFEFVLAVKISCSVELSI